MSHLVDGAWSDDVISDCLIIRQHKAGYRFGIDALLLATDLPAFERVGQHIIEFGAAHGPVCLSIASRLESVDVLGVEVQTSLSDLLRHNIEHNQNLFGSSSVRCLHADVRDVRDHVSAHQAALVLFNPPYFPLSKRRPSQHQERAIARHEVKGSLGDFIRAAQFVLHPKGWCKFVLPPWRMTELFSIVSQTDFGLSSLRFIHANTRQPAYLVEVLLRRASNTDMLVHPMLCIRGEDGYYTQEISQRVAGAARVSPPDDLVEHVRLRSLSR